jgi:hypothetical protein
MGPTASLDDVERIKTLPSPGLELKPPAVQPVTGSYTYFTVSTPGTVGSSHYSSINQSHTETMQVIIIGSLSMPLVTTAWRVHQVADGGYRIAANILNKQSRRADKGWFFSWGVGRGANNSTS